MRSQRGTKVTKLCMRYFDAKHKEITTAWKAAEEAAVSLRIQALGAWNLQQGSNQQVIVAVTTSGFSTSLSSLNM